jgi:hypothetical protein
MKAFSRALRRNLLLVPLVAVALVACVAAQQATPDRLTERFKQFDRNGDGKLSVEESGQPELHKRMDRNGDGYVTLEEARQYYRSRKATQKTPTAPPAKVVAADRLNAVPAPPPAVPPLTTSHAFTELRFSKDYFPGTNDARGQYQSGTETIRILTHQGKLFASTGVWMDLPYLQSTDQRPWTGPQVLIKKSAKSPWRVDVSFPLAIRIDAITSATFRTDGASHRLAPPVNLLIASPSSENTATWTRDDATGKWTESLASGGLRGGLRSFCTHLDLVTKVQYLFGGSTKSGCIFRAVYDASAPGKLRWHEEPELSGAGRVMCMAEANGVLYAAAGIKDESPLSGGLFRRVDGQQPRWELLWRWPHLIRERGDESEIMRGLTAIPDPAGGKHQVLLAACAYPGVVYRIDPTSTKAVTTELDVRAYFAKAFGAASLRGPSLIAYNLFLPAVDPDTGEKVHLIGVWVNHSAGRGTELGDSAWYLVRHADGTYGHGRIFAPQHPHPAPPRGLLAARTIEMSPFVEDKGRVLYWGGFDCAGIESHNTAWIYRATLPEGDRHSQPRR